jgi:hypothetical protein
MGCQLMRRRRQLGPIGPLHKFVLICAVMLENALFLQPLPGPGWRWINKTEKSFSNLATSQFCYSISNKSTTTLQF